MTDFNSRKLRRFITHLCRVSQHYYALEQAQNNLHSHLTAIKGHDAQLDHHVNTVIHHAIKVSELGKGKYVPHGTRKELENLRHDLQTRNIEVMKLKQTKDHADELSKHIHYLENLKLKKGAKISTIERDVDKKVHDQMIDELQESIERLEQSYKVIRTDPSYHPARVHNIKLKIDEYKKKLKTL